MRKIKTPKDIDKSKFYMIRETAKARNFCNKVTVCPTFHGAKLKPIGLDWWDKGYKFTREGVTYSQTIPVECIKEWHEKKQLNNP